MIYQRRWACFNLGRLKDDKTNTEIRGENLWPLLFKNHSTGSRLHLKRVEHHKHGDTASHIKKQQKKKVSVINQGRI